MARRSSVLPWPRAGLAGAGQADDALGDDVAKDLRRTGLDRVAAAAQLLVLPVAVPDRAVAVELGGQALQRERELRQPLVGLRPVQLRDRPLRAGHAGLLQRG